MRNGGATSSSLASIPNLKPSHIVIEMEPSQTHAIKTSMGASLVKVIGYDNTVHEVDELRYKLKQYKREKADKKKEVIQRYKHLSSLIEFGAGLAILYSLLLVDLINVNY